MKKRKHKKDFNKMQSECFLCGDNKPNRETIASIERSEKNIGIKTFDSFEDLFKDLFEESKSEVYKRYGNLFKNLSHR